MKRKLIFIAILVFVLILLVAIFRGINIGNLEILSIAQIQEKDRSAVKKYETKQYDISYLWKVLGNYAKSRNLTLGMDVKISDSKNNLYNLNFSVSGRYIDIIQFIKDIENDSDLYFRIYNFRMSGSSTIVSSSFAVQNVNIDPSTIKGAQSNNAELFN